MEKLRLVVKPANSLYPPQEQVNRKQGKSLARITTEKRYLGLSKYFPDKPEMVRFLHNAYPNFPLIYSLGKKWKKFYNAE